MSARKNTDSDAVDLDASKVKLGVQSAVAYTGFLFSVLSAIVGALIWGLGHFATAESLEKHEAHEMAAIGELNAKLKSYDEESRKILEVVTSTREVLAGLKGRIEGGSK